MLKKFRLQRPLISLSFSRGSTVKLTNILNRSCDSVDVTVMFHRLRSLLLGDVIGRAPYPITLKR